MGRPRLLHDLQDILFVHASRELFGRDKPQLAVRLDNFECSTASAVNSMPSSSERRVQPLLQSPASAGGGYSFWGLGHEKRWGLVVGGWWLELRNWGRWRRVAWCAPGFFGRGPFGWRGAAASGFPRSASASSIGQACPPGPSAVGRSPDADAAAAKIARSLNRSSVSCR
jgi:hypothetical protein